MTKPPSVIRESDGVLYVALTHGAEAIVDVGDRHLVEGKRWILHTTPSGHAYAGRFERGKCILMHRELLDAPTDRHVDHEDGNGINNRRKNIRLATPAQNQANIGVTRRNKLHLKGVYVDRGKYRASIKTAGKSVFLGAYSTPEEATAAYRGAAKALWGDFAKK